MKQLELKHIDSVHQFTLKNPLLVKATLTLDEGLKVLSTLSAKKSKFNTTYNVILTTRSMRHRLFLEGHLFCSCCGVEGNKFKIFQDRRGVITDTFKIALFGNTASGKEVEFNWDHIIPRSLEGSEHIENAQIMCEDCNRAKGNIVTLDEFARIKNLPSYTKMTTNKNLTEKRIINLAKNTTKHKFTPIKKYHHPVSKPVYNFITFN